MGGRGPNIVMNFMGILSSKFVLAMNLPYHLKYFLKNMLAGTRDILTEVYASSVSPAKCQGSTLIRPRPLSSNSFRIHHSVVILPSNAIFLTLKTSLNKPQKIIYIYM
jgi:hypothetical protein